MSKIQNNNTSLEEVLEIINNLPENNNDSTINITGEPGQMVTFDTEGNLISMPLLEDIIETEEIVGNLFDPSVGYTEGYGTPTGPINLETLEVPLDNPVTNGESTAYMLHNELIYLEPNTTYAISKFIGNGTAFVAGSGSRSGYINPTNLVEGDNCYLYTTASSDLGYYLAIQIHTSSPTAYKDMIIIKGESLPTKTTVLVGTRLNENIKVKAEQVEGLEEIIPEGGSSGSNDSQKLEPLTINGVKYDGTEPVDIEISSNGSIDISGTLGQVVGFDADGNLAPMPLLEDITETETIVGNLFDASVGYTKGYTSPSGSINLETLEVPLDTADSTVSWLHNALIHLEPNTTYAISKFNGRITTFNDVTGARSGFCMPGTNLTEGDNCYLMTTLDRDYGFYMAISIHSATSPTAYKDMIIVKGDTISTETTTVVVGTRLKENIRINAEQVDGLEEMIPKGGNDATSASSDFDKLYAVARKIQNYQSPTTLTFSLMSDTHYHDENLDAVNSLITARTMGLVGDYAHIDFIGNLGDMVRGDEELEATRKALAKLVVATNQNAKCPVLLVRGNHDDNGWYTYGNKGGSNRQDEIINGKEWYQSAFGIKTDGVVIDKMRNHGGYGYWDDEKSKIRVFLLNSQDLPYILENGAYRYNSYQYLAYSNDQLKFVANSLMFSDKDKPNEWAALFLSHVPLDTTNDDGYRFGAKDHLPRGHEWLLAIIAAYRKGASFKYSGSATIPNSGDVADDFIFDIDVDYTSKGAGDVIGFINGHTHADHFSRSVGYENSLSRNYAFLGLMGSTEYSTFIIDRENSTIHVVKYGDSVLITDERDDLAGSVQDAPDVGTIESGEWSVTFNQFRPDNTNLYNGLSEIHTSGGISSATKINTTTLEIDATAGDSKYRTSKAIVVKPFTRYAIPSNWNGSLLALGQTGGRSGFITPTMADGYKYFQTGIRQYYVVFDHHTGSYSDYANFWIKEMGEGVEYN